MFALIGFSSALIEDIVIEEEFEQLEGFGQVGFSVEFSDIGVFRAALFSALSDEIVFDKENINSSRDDFRNRFSSRALEIESVHEEVDTGFFNVDERAIKQTYIIRNKEDVEREVTLNVLYEIDSDFVFWNGSEYGVLEREVCFEAFEEEMEIFPGVGEMTWAGHTLYFGNNYYDFRDVLGFDYEVCVYSLDGKSYIDLEVRGEVGALSEWVVDPEIGWTSHVISDSVSQVRSIYAVDIDSDGDVDVVSASLSDYKIAWHENIGGGSFVSHNISVSENGAWGVSAADIDSDGDVDILFTSINTDKIVWYENDGNEGFVQHIIAYADGAVSVYAVDIDFDGDIDVLSASVYDDKIVWYENDGNENFASHVITASADGAFSVYAIDVDSDGDIDVLSANQYDDKIVWYENDGEEGFVSHVITASADGAISVYAIDVDSDGDIDVLSASMHDDKIAWYENDGNENFVAREISVLVNYARFVYAIDVDFDGDIDVLSASFKGDKVILHENDGNENFASKIVSSSVNGAISIHAADIDSDGDVDIVSAGMYSNTIVWHESNLSLEASCSGNVNVFVEGSDGNVMDGLYGYLNNGEEVLSDEDGSFGYDVSCYEVFDIEVRCRDNVEVCGVKSSVASYDGDVDSMSFVCDVCREGKDVFVIEDELIFDRIDEGLRINVSVHSVGLSEDVGVSLIKNCGGIKSLVEEKNVFVSAGGIEVVSFVDSFSDCEKIDVILEYFDGEDYSENNYIRDFFVIEPLKVYLEVDVGYTYVDEIVRRFLGEYVEMVSSGSEAELEIYVGRKLYEYGSVDVSYLDKGLIFYEGKKEGLPYNGLIQQGAFGAGNKVYVFGNDIDGDIAAVKRLVFERENYLNGRMLGLDMGDVYLGGGDVGAVGVYDYLHTEENVGAYKGKSGLFAEVVDSVLRDRTFNLEVKRVLTSNDNTSLRMKHLGSEYSFGFRSFMGERGVVMAGGLFSDLTMWEGGGDGLAIDLGRSGRDVWEIEITGGPGTECEECPDYTYEDLVDYYWPALVAGVQYYSGDVTVDYVGHSNGCRVALSSLSKYQESGKVDAGVVDGIVVDLEGGDVVGTFIGVGCPGELNDGTFLSAVARENVYGNNAGNLAVGLIGSKHTTMSGYTGILFKLGILDGNFYSSLAGLAMIFSGDEKISRNLMGYYNGLAVGEDSEFDLGGLNVEKLRLYNGNILGLGHDGVVPVEDMSVILDGIDGADKNTIEDGVYVGFPLEVDHIFIKDKNDVKEKIMEDLR